MYLNSKIHIYFIWNSSWTWCSVFYWLVHVKRFQMVLLCSSQPILRHRWNLARVYISALPYWHRCISKPHTNQNFPSTHEQKQIFSGVWYWGFVVVYYVILLWQKLKLLRTIYKKYSRKRVCLGFRWRCSNCDEVLWASRNGKKKKKLYRHTFKG